MAQTKGPARPHFMTCTRVHATLVHHGRTALAAKEQRAAALQRRTAAAAAAAAEEGARLEDGAANMQRLDALRQVRHTAYGHGRGWCLR